jgi:hypothetical protein
MLGPRNLFVCWVLVCSAGLSGCSAWTSRAKYPHWTLWTRDGTTVDAAAFERAMDPAVQAIESAMGRFERRIDVHAWDGGVALESGVRGRVIDGEEPLLEVAGIGPARVRAFHSRGDGSPFSRGGIFLGEPDVSAAAHELVHARLAEIGLAPPLWFEEGLANYYSDGALRDGVWQVDGFAFWPWKELRAQRLSDAELQSLLALGEGAEHSLRENLLVHFLGWALVFDLARAAPDGAWTDWYASGTAAYGPDALEANPTAALAAARNALERTLDPRTPLNWLDRLEAPEPAVRLAAVRGAWKLPTAEVGEKLLAAIGREQDPEVRVALVLNLLIGPGQARFGWQNWWRVRKEAVPHLKDPGFADPEEAAAALKLHAAWRGRGGGAEAQTALRVLRRLWEE